jgi:iron(III) transport system substrate-binding protein
MIHRRLRVSIAVTASIASFAALAACGNDDGSAPATTAAPAATTTAAPATTAAPGTTAAPQGPGATPEEWEKIVAAAKAEGKVVVYSVMLPNQNEALEKGFEAAYPEIDMEVIRITGGDMEARLQAESETRAEGGDLGAHINYQWVINAKNKGDLIEIIGPDARGPDWEGTPWMVDGYIQYTAFQLLGIGCNTQVIQPCPKSYKELLNPEYRELIGAVEPGHQVLMDFWNFMEAELGGEAGMGQFRDLKPVFFASAVPAQQALGAGEIGVTSYATNQLKADAAAGAPVEFVIPQPAWSPPIISYILGWSRNPNAAQVALNWMATREAQSLITINGASALPGIEGTLAQIENIQPLDIFNNTAEWAKPYQDRWKAFFGRQ